MNKILLFFLSVLSFYIFIACSSDNDPETKDKTKNKYIDERILGKWRVEYYTDIHPASYDPETGELTYNPETARIIEYIGPYDEENGVNPPTNGMFHPNAYQIEISEDNRITITYGNGYNKKEYYIIEQDFFLWITSHRIAGDSIEDILNYPEPPTGYKMNYIQEDNKLTLIRFEATSIYENVENICITEYSRIE